MHPPESCQGFEGQLMLVASSNGSYWPGIKKPTRLRRPTALHKLTTFRFENFTQTNVKARTARTARNGSRAGANFRTLDKLIIAGSIPLALAAKVTAEGDSFLLMLCSLATDEQAAGTVFLDGQIHRYPDDRRYRNCVSNAFPNLR